MKVLIYPLFLTILIGCASIPNVDIPHGSTIAVIYETPDYICHDHTGMTVFNNFIKYYPLSSNDIEGAVFEGYKLGFEEAGYKVLRRKTEDVFGDLIPNSATMLSPAEAKKFLSTVEKEGISLVLYTNSMTEMNLSNTPPIEAHNYCEGGVVLFTGSGRFRAEVLAYSMDTTAFDAKSGKNLGRLHLNTHPDFSASKPSDLNEITHKELQTFLSDLTENARFKASLIVKSLKASST